MKKAVYEELLREEQPWRESLEHITDFWVNGLTHIVISKTSDGAYQILRSWVWSGSNTPAVSIDVENGTINDVISYLIKKIGPTPPLISED